MSEYTAGLISSIWFGILMSISPCPLATNIAAISYISRDLGDSRRILLTGLLYTLGRTLVYLVLGILMVYSLTNFPLVANFLQKYMNKILGPVLIIIGMFLLELINFTTRGSGISDKMQKKVGRWGVWGALPIGILFALSFCPVSAGLFFGSLLTNAVRFKSAFLMPSLFGIGSALPVIVFSLLFVFGVQYVGKAFSMIQKFEYWARRITGFVFILVGIYYCLSYIFQIM
jgi:cytochrome c-type biogenesis protein